MKRRVVVTGAGAVTPLGSRVSDIWSGILESRCVADFVKAFDASQFPCRIAYEVSEFNAADLPIPDATKRQLNRAGAFGVKACLDALAAAGLTHSTIAGNIRFGMNLGVGMGCPDYNWFTENYIPGKMTPDLYKDHIKYFPNTLTDCVAELAGIEGELITVHTACASSGQSVGEAYELIAYGDADLMLTGGADSMINPFYFAGFCLLGALTSQDDDPKTACRPFDKDRSGFVLGEGACALVLEEYEHAKARGADILGEVVGYGVTESAYRITDLHPDGEGPIQAMEMAVQDAGIDPLEVGYVNAHGTSTILNDQIEALSVQRVFGDENVRVSSTKSMTGHLISAAGAMEFLLAMLAVKYQVLPPSLNVVEQDVACPVRLTGKHPEAKKMSYALSNSVGFGGSNTALIAKGV